MNKPSTQLRVLHAIVGACLLVFGLRTVLTRKIGADGTQLRGAGWLLEGEPAVLIGFLLGVTGAYIIYLAFNAND